MTEKLEDVWASRDFPVLREITRLIDSGEEFPHKAQLAKATGLSADEVRLAAWALRRRGLIDFNPYAGGDFSVITDLAGQAYLLTGLHPDGDDLVSQLVSALRQAAEQAVDPEEKGRLRTLADNAGAISRNVLSGVLTAVVTGAVT